MDSHTLIKLCIRDSPESLRSLVPSSLNTNNINEQRLHHGRTLLMYATKNHKSTENVKILLSAGASLEVKDLSGKTALMHAVRNRNLACVEVLLQAGAKIEAANLGATPLVTASSLGFLECVELFLRYGANVEGVYAPDAPVVKDRCAVTPLLSACMYGHVEIAKMLIDQGGAMIDVRDGADETPLTISSFRGHTDCVKALLERGAKVNSKNWCGFSSLHHAADRGHVKCIELLLDNGADMEATTTDGAHTALVRACVKGYDKCVRLLIERGASIDTWARSELEDDEDMIMTPLMCASGNGNADCVRELLRQGCNADLMNDLRMTARHFAQDNHHMAIVVLLDEFGEKK